MRGHAMKTPERVAEAQRLREQGWKLREIADHFGTRTQTVHAWLTDPDGSRSRARKDSYRGICVECGSSTTGCFGPGKAPELCRVCYPEATKVWTRDAVVLAIQEWADEHGGVPPSATDWNVTLNPERGDGWPATNTVRVTFGTWNAAITAAGFEPRGVGHYGRDGEDEDYCRMIAERYDAGATAAVLALEFECSPGAILYQARKGGATIRPLGNPGRLTEDEWQLIAQRYLAGETGTTLAGEHGVTPSCIYAGLRRRDVELRPRGARPSMAVAA